MHTLVGQNLLCRLVLDASDDLTKVHRLDTWTATGPLYWFSKSAVCWIAFICNELFRGEMKCLHSMAFPMHTIHNTLPASSAFTFYLYCQHQLCFIKPNWPLWHWRRTAFTHSCHLQKIILGNYSLPSFCLLSKRWFYRHFLDLPIDIDDQSIDFIFTGKYVIAQRYMEKGKIIQGQYLVWGGGLISQTKTNILLIKF